MASMFHPRILADWHVETHLMVNGDRISPAIAFGGGGEFSLTCDTISERLI